ncbi:HNH endonuclease signature motif containing protein [Asaia bogorensis]|uniref:HNH endonuclease signature motif containing protein n=1 Tax=Asaia bogorensis TaxID=91915 RepID=UPI002857B2B4|nr:HNH endonuclease signature motif containing protein [Asaia bogorensis]MDR6182096.1 5-methylcytosine-specific restriction protein A [Asaia bogorensis NBRC 16594]
MATRKAAVLRCINSGLTALDTSIARVPPKTTDGFYLSKEWRALLASVIKQRGRVCERCGRTGCRIFGDHIHELKDGGARLDLKNIMLLCGSCHSTKTVRARIIRNQRIATPSLTKE